jgi:hypothetical protein
MLFKRLWAITVLKRMSRRRQKKLTEQKYLGLFDLNTLTVLSKFKPEAFFTAALIVIRYSAFASENSLGISSKNMPSIERDFALNEFQPE